MENKKQTHSKQDCIFCKIISGEIPSYKVFENEKILAFIDIFPVNLGHTLIIPKDHAENIFELDENTHLEISKHSKIIAKNIKEKFNCDGINILQNNGKASGQEVHHYHMHIIPRYENDKMILKFNSNSTPISKQQADKILEKLK